MTERPENEHGEVDRPYGDLAPDVAAGGLIGFAFGGPFGAAAGALTPIAARVIRLGQREGEARISRAEEMWRIASRQSEKDVNALFEVAESDADRLHLAYVAGEHAATARYSAKIVALGRALATGLLAEDEAVLDHQQLMVDAMAEVERPHLVLLGQLVTIEGSVEEPVFVRRTLSWDVLRRLSGRYGTSLPRLLATLEREGLVHQETVAVVAGDDGRLADAERSGAFWRITDFGYEVLNELWRAGASDMIDEHGEAAPD